jgi:hypothetical protein
MKTIKFGVGETLIEVRGDTGEILLSKTERQVPMGPMLTSEAPPCEDVALLHYDEDDNIKRALRLRQLWLKILTRS